MQVRGVEEGKGGVGGGENKNIKKKKEKKSRSPDSCVLLHCARVSRVTPEETLHKCIKKKDRL